MKRLLTEIVIIIVSFPICFAFAWVPMLAWNFGVGVVFPQLPKIDYVTAFWFALGLTYVKTVVVPIKE